MTRINADLNPRYLLDQVLMAEYRELPMVFGSLNRSLKSVNYDIGKLIKRVPKQFTLNDGHVMFFYPRLGFLMDRYRRLVDELLHRSYDLDPDRDMYSLDQYPSELHGDYHMTSVDKEVIVERLVVRYYKQPEWYKYCGDPVDPKTFKFLLENA